MSNLFKFYLTLLNLKEIIDIGENLIAQGNTDYINSEIDKNSCRTASIFLYTLFTF